MFERETAPEILTEEQMEIVHEHAMRILEEIGTDVMHEEARKLLGEAGLKVVDARVHWDRGFVMDQVAKAPSSFRLRARNPERSLPALSELRPDLKHEPLSTDALGHVLELEPFAVLVDAVENPGQAWSVLQDLRSRATRAWSRPAAISP